MEIYKEKMNCNFLVYIVAHKLTATLPPEGAPPDVFTATRVPTKPK